MRGYGQFCPVAKAAELLTERWTPLVVRELLAGSTRFNELRRGVPLMSPSLLSKRLKDLEQAGVVERRRGSGGAIEYHLTESGRELGPIVRIMGEWGQRWLRSRLTRDRLDAALLLWDMRRWIDPGRFPSGRTVVRIELTDQPMAKRYWWLVSEEEQEEVDLCPTDPGHDVDLYLAADLRTLTEVWMGDLALSRATDEGRLTVVGRSDLRRRLRSWLQLSSLAGIRPAPGARGSATRRSR